MKLTGPTELTLVQADGSEHAVHPLWLRERCRDAATMDGDVDVLGQYNYLDVWNHERFLTKLQRDAYTDDDARALSEFGI